MCSDKSYWVSVQFDEEMGSWSDVMIMEWMAINCTEGKVTLGKKKNADFVFSFPVTLRDFPPDSDFDAAWFMEALSLIQSWIKSPRGELPFDRREVFPNAPPIIKDFIKDDSESESA